MYCTYTVGSKFFAVEIITEKYSISYVIDHHTFRFPWALLAQFADKIVVAIGF